MSLVDKFKQGGRKDKPVSVNKKPPIVGTEIITCACGHTWNMELYPPKADIFRERRREKMKESPCPACRERAHKELTLKQQEQAKQRRKDPEHREKHWPKWKKEAHQNLPRLPHESRFDVSYDSKLSLWKGELIIPEGDQERVFSAQATAVFKLLNLLDTLYRIWLEEQKPQEVTTNE